MALELGAASVAAGLGAAVQGSIGFGLSLVAVPILILIDPRLVPGPVLCVAILLTVLIAHRERRSIDFAGVGWALAGRLPGTVAGATALALMPREGLGLIFGTLVLAAVLMSAFKFGITPRPWSLALAGLFSGFMGTTVAIGGPPMALLLQHSPGAQLRGTLSGFFVVGASVSLLALILIGHFGWQELAMAGALAPGILLGFLVSRRTTAFLDRGFTRSAVLAAAAIAGVVAILRQVI